MNTVKNERGEIVVAVGAPNSLARLKCEFPDTWWKMLDDSLLEYMALYPTHEYEVDVHFGTGISPAKMERRFCTLLGDVTHNGKKTFYYAEMQRLEGSPVVYAPGKFYTYEELKRIPQNIQVVKESLTPETEKP